MRSMTLFFTVMVICINTFAQNDSIYVSEANNIFPRYQFVYPNGENSVCEHYMSFKGQFLLEEKTTIISIKELHKQNNASLVKGKKPVFVLYHACDSFITTIRNSAFLHKVESELNNFHRQEIANNDEIREFRNLNERNFFKNYSSCFEEFSSKVKEYQKETEAKIYTIIKEKEERSTNLIRSTKVSQGDIISFLKTFDECLPDMKAFEKLVIHQPKDVLSAMVSSFNENDFFLFTLNLDRFPVETEIQEMKMSLKNTASKSPRKKKLIKALKKTK